MMKKNYPGLFVLVAFLVLALMSCEAQENPPQYMPRDSDKKVGGPCDACEAIFAYGDKKLSTIDTLPEFNQNQQPLRISGTVFQKDGHTPASDILLYIYHTDEKGLYQQKRNSAGTNHIFHRGWIKTDQNGHYTFYTFLPGSYPGRDEPRHIHPLIKESGKSVYYIDDFVFDHDPLLTTAKRKTLANRGGSGIIQVSEEAGMLSGQRDIILGKNIPNYD